MNDDEFLLGLEKDAIKFGKKFGRPLKEINFEIFQNLCRIQCTLEEIASCFSCSEDTIERRVKERYGNTFAEVYKIYSGHGKMSLRRKQFEVAMNGNTALLIKLGEQYLNQSAKVQINEKQDSEKVSSLSDDELDKSLNELENND